MNKTKVDLAIKHMNDLFMEIYTIGYEQSKKDLFKQVNKVLSLEHKKAIREATHKVEREKKAIPNE